MDSATYDGAMRDPKPPILVVDDDAKIVRLVRTVEGQPSLTGR